MRSCCFSVVHRRLFLPRSLLFSPASSTGLYTLSLHDALPISHFARTRSVYTIHNLNYQGNAAPEAFALTGDRKSTRLNSSHLVISYAVFCLKKKTTFLTKEHRVHYTTRSVLEPTIVEARHGFN